MLAQLIFLHAFMDKHPIVAYNADHEVLPYDTVLPTRQQHIEGNDNVTIGDEGRYGFGGWYIPGIYLETRSRVGGVARVR